MQDSQPLNPSEGMPITTEELLATIGELTIQVRVLRRMLAQKQERVEPTYDSAITS